MTSWKIGQRWTSFSLTKKQLSALTINTRSTRKGESEVEQKQERESAEQEEKNEGKECGH